MWSMCQAITFFHYEDSDWLYRFGKQGLWGTVTRGCIKVFISRFNEQWWGLDWYLNQHSDWGEGGPGMLSTTPV